ncbi:carbon catabolite repressor protein 4 homolog 6-like isoform X2 [Lolium rigidum]|uniref:carbon catabolite repressor protein 4 homolog 6-like isoform X2 n=1 Tax=Lolium rigidum TaxID=89674 RepID=UPI001F5DB68D|nr:carbon catabolite repressor protein 4 homolog 6-like isoform X2 [Lolium rigidum]
MRLVPSASLRRAASMSSHYNRRGSPWPHRGYSSRPSPPYAYAGAANDSLPGGGGAHAPPPQYAQGPQFQPPPSYGYGYGQPQVQPQVQSYGAVPYNYSHPQQPLPNPRYAYGNPNQNSQWRPQPYGPLPPNAGFQPPNAGFQQPNAGFMPPNAGFQQSNAGFMRPNAGFRPWGPQPRPRLAEYKREWRYVQKLPPRQAERFKVMSYNILADYLAQDHHDLYEGIPPCFMDWNWRKNKIGLEIRWWLPDILCFQEVDNFGDLEKEMAMQGFKGIWKMRTGNAVDGCAIFWRATRFQLRYEESIEFNKLGLRDNVAQLCVLESLVQRNVQTGSVHLSTSQDNPQQANQVVVCNIHVLYNPKRGDIKLGQVRTLLDRAYAISKMRNDAPVILCGDFNATPKSPLYNFLSEQKLNLSGLTRYNISGQQTSSSQGLYAGCNSSRYTFRPPLHTTNGREGRIITRDGDKPQSEAKDSVRGYCLAEREPDLTDTASTSFLNSESSKCPGNNRPCSGSSDLNEQGSPSCMVGHAKDACNSDSEAHVKATEGEGAAVGNSCEEGFGGSKIESKESDIADLQYSPAAVYDEILQSDSSETVDSRHLLSCHGSSGLKDSLGESRGVSSKDSNSHGRLSGDVFSEDVACSFEGSSVQSDTVLNVSEDNPSEMEKCNQSMSGRNNGTTTELESSHFSDSPKFADTLHEMSNMRVDEEINTGPTRLTSPVEPVPQSNCATSDACGNQDEYRLPTISNRSPDVQRTVPYGRYYNDPYRWTVDEIKAATGKEECTYVEHNLKVRSVYTDVEDFGGTKDANKEPLVTSYNRKFMGTVDYIWASKDLQTVNVLDTFPREILKQTIGFPTKKWGSDHIALVCELAFTNDTHQTGR